MKVRTVFIVDGETALCQNLVDYLQEEGYDLVCAATCAEALRLAERRKPDVALVDFKLPDGFGTNLLPDLRRINPECLFVMTTAYADVQSAVTALTEGAFHYLEKPVLPGELIQLLDRLTEILCLREQKRAAEEAVREREELLRATLESTADGILVVSDTGRATHMNARFGEMWRIPEELIETRDNEKLLDFVQDQFEEPEAFVSRVHELDETLAENSETLVFKDGRVFERYSCPLVLGGRKAGRVWSFRDITERKKAGDALRVSEEKYRLLVENANEAIFVVQDQVVKFANPKTVELTGYAAEELAEARFFDLIHPEDREAVFKRHQRRLAGEEIPSTHSFRLLSRAGEVLSVQQNAVLITWEGRPGTLNFLRDITLEKRLEVQLQQSQKMEAVGTLAGGVAHDFNNLLQAIRGYAQLLLLETSPGDQAYAKLREIEFAARRAGELTRRLLTFSRKVESELRPLDLNHEVTQLEKLLVRTIPKMIGVELRLAEDLRTIKADASQIEQVLMNLGLNARDAMPEGGRLIIETANVVLEEAFCQAHPGARPGEHVLLSISDTGEGMDRETLGRIFEPFYTTKAPGQGTGLGLAMVYGIVKNHGGYITCSSEPGQGTTFRIYFPAIESLAGPDEEEGAVSLLAGGTEMVLLVDDEEYIRNFGQELLKKAGYTVLTAPDGETALEVYRREKEGVALVILDLIMPGMGGRRCLQELLRVNPEVKVAVSSGYAAEASADEAVKAGAKGFIHKPYELDQMLKVIRQILDEDYNPSQK